MIIISLDGSHIIRGSDSSDDSDKDPAWEITKKPQIENDKGKF